MNSDVVLVNLDDATKKQSGLDLWPYDLYAATFEKINAGEPTSLGIDVIFTITLDTTGWQRLLMAIENSYVAVNPYLVEFGLNDIPLSVYDHPVILDELGYDDLPVVQPNKVKHIVNIPYKPKPDFMESGSLGLVNIEADADGILRRIPVVAEMNGMLVPHFFLRILCQHKGYDLSNIDVVSDRLLVLQNFPMDSISTKNLEIPLDGNGNMIINYLSEDKIQNLRKSGKFVSISAIDIINSPKPPNLRGRTVIFGDHTPAVKDFSNTPLDSTVPNSLIYGILISNILENSFIQTPSSGIPMVLVVLLFIVMVLLATTLDVFRFGILSTGILIGYIVINFIVFVYFGWLIPVFPILIPVGCATGFMLIYLVYQSQVTMGVLEGSLQSYLSPHLMDKIKNDPDMLKLGGERKRITVLFSDIAGFTSFTDKADPAEVQAVLEEYFSEMTSIVFANKGIVDKYMGDGIMAFFENPPDGVTSAQAAIKSAVAMQKKAGELDEKYKDQNRFPFSVYVGIATGYAKVGNIGPPEKVDYTVIGSVVNKASRLDSAGTAGDILLDEDTYFFVKDDYEIEDFGSHELKGFEKLVQIFRLKKSIGDK
ncbi:MAG: adenylate/guanylate cyclase domain-containing protein [Candidatus Marinimicrobia bacterium]|nr:adenylate/guanylate cyclase domain-containing protein [Candidatus Neomarinimicrobiota bacterium]